MQRYLSRPSPFIRNPRIITFPWKASGFATASHPNPANFANRPKEELSEIARKGGRKGGKAKGVGGFHNMDPEKQHEIASRGGRAARKAAMQREESRSHQPSTAPPGFKESYTV